jgi:hypothetical protein
MRGRYDFGVNEILDWREAKITNYSLAYQHKETIDKFNKHIDNKSDIGGAELLYRLNLLEYKKQFVTFCLRNHLDICMDSIEKRRYEEWKSNQPSTYMEDDQPECYEDATMRHSKYEDIHLK